MRLLGAAELGVGHKEMLEFLAAMAMTWFFHAVPALIVCAPIWIFGRHRVLWSRIDYLIIVIPWAIWVLLFIFGPRPGSLSSALVEAVTLGILTAIAPILRVSATQVNPSLLRYIGFGVVTLSGIFLWALVPFIGE